MPKKILLADDSITIQKVVELTFSDGDYDVVAVNNGAKAIQKLAELRPDIILSDIIMPEKNGYEVCEYVKSHPDLRNIPVILLTGTFEPFDPDRAEKAGCDAVVTKPFESQSLIHKVEELVAQAQANAQANAAPPAPPVPEPTPWADEPAQPAPSAPQAPSFHPPAASSYEPVTAAYEPPPAPAFAGGAEEVPFGGSGSSFNASTSAFSSSPEPFAGGFQTHGDDIFGAGQAAESPATTEMPFDTPEPEIYGGDTRTFQKMDFDELQRLAGAQPAVVPPPSAPPAPPAETSPWDEPPAFGGETRAFPRMSFEELQQMGSAAPPATPEPAAPWNEPAPAPWDEPTAPAWGDETSSMRRSDLGEFAQPAASGPSAPQTSPWDQPAAAPAPAA
ncbi:MAG: response regulator receiver protein, partial [Acidobacteria bacterium]|nr:response regulator receiver protein [Acidobacteriota bacterium]